jgi:hypothetical protein
MRISSLASFTLGASITLTALAGCGSSQVTPAPLMQSSVGSSSMQEAAFQTGRLNGLRSMRGGIVPAQPAAGPSFMDRRAVGKPLVFVSYDDGAIDIYLQGGKNKMVGQITESIEAVSDLATDTAGNLYSITSPPSSSSVTVYAPPYTNGPKLTISTPNAYLVAVSRQGTVAVAVCTIASGSQCGLGVQLYAAGSTTPCNTVLLYKSAFLTAAGMAFDHKGNLYVPSYGSGSPAPLPVAEINGGCHAKKVKTFTTANSIANVGDIHVDKAGRLAILVALGTYPYTFAIDAYDPPKNGSLGNPVSTTSLPGTFSSPPFPSGYFAFLNSGRGLWAGYENVGPSYAGGAYELSYPAGGVPEKTITSDPGTFAYGVAVTPALVP